MAIEISTVEVFERALLLSVEERKRLAKQLLRSLDQSDAEPEQISARFQALDARFRVACTVEIERTEDDEPFGGARLA